MKVDGNGQAKILTRQELEGLFSFGFSSPRDKAIFAICLFSACRIGEALQLEKNSVTAQHITFKKATTKGKQATRQITICHDLKEILNQYQPLKPFNPYYFPGQKDYLRLNQASKIFHKACDKVGIVGASTHSMRRTALTQMHKNGISLRTIQEISGHKSLAALQKYLEVSEEEKTQALKSIGW